MAVASTAASSSAPAVAPVASIFSSATGLYPSVYEDPEFQQEQARAAAAQPPQPPASAAAAASAARPIAEGPVNLGIVSPENCDLLDGVQKLVDELWRQHGQYIAGEAGYKAIRLQAVRDSHPEFPIFASVLGSMPSLGNGRIPPCYVHRCVA